MENAKKYKTWPPLPEAYNHTISDDDDDDIT